MLVLGLLFVPDLRKTTVSRIVLWISLSDMLWWTSGMLENALDICWNYPIDLFFSAASSAWTAVMAFHLVFHMRITNAYLEYFYAYAVLAFASAITVPIVVVSGGYVKTDPPVPGYCNPANKLKLDIFSVAVIVEVVITITICILAFLILRFCPLKKVIEYSFMKPSDYNINTNPKSLPNVVDDDHSYATLEEADNAYSTNGRYLAVYVICWSPRLVFEFWNLHTPNQDIPWSLKIIAQLMLSSIGFWNAVVYGSMPPDYQFQRLWFHVIGGLWRLSLKIFPSAAPGVLAESILKPEEEETAFLASKLNINAYTVQVSELKFQQKIGHGASGVTYLAIYHGSKVAVKEFFNVYNNEGVEAFKNEVLMLGTLAHTYVARFIGISHAPPDKYYLVMEYYPRVLSKMIESQEHMNTEFKLRILLQLSEAMEFLHSKKITHI